MGTGGESFDIDTTSLTIAAKRWGQPEGPNVLGLHGWLDNAATFDHLGPYLSEFNFVAIDFPGHGLSEHLHAGAPYYFFDLVPIFFDVVDALGWDNFGVFGHSMGAAAALIAGGVFPDRFDRMFLVDGLGPKTTPPADAPEQMADGVKQRKTLLEKTGRVFEDLDDAKQTIAEVYEATTEQVAPIVERGTEPVAEGVGFTYDLMLRGTSLLRLTEPQVEAFMTGIDCPIHLVRPDTGWPVPSAWVERRMSYLRDLETSKIEGHHHVHLQHPEAIADRFRAFVSTSGDGS